MPARNPINFFRVLLAAGSALLANAIAYAIGSAAGATWDVGMPFKVGIAMVIGATLAPMVLGALVARFAAARWAKSQSWFAWGVLALAVVSAPGGLVSSPNLATGISLAAMHVVVGLAWFWAIKPVKKSEQTA